MLFIPIFHFYLLYVLYFDYCVNIDYRPRVIHLLNKRFEVVTSTNKQIVIPREQWAAITWRPKHVHVLASRVPQIWLCNSQMTHQLRYSRRDINMNANSTVCFHLFFFQYPSVNSNDSSSEAERRAPVNFSTASIEILSRRRFDLAAIKFPRVSFFSSLLFFSTEIYLADAFLIVSNNILRTRHLSYVRRFLFVKHGDIFIRFGPSTSETESLSEYHCYEENVNRKQGKIEPKNNRRLYENICVLNFLQNW